MLYDKQKPIEILTLPDLMVYLAIGKYTAYKLLKSGQIKSFKIGKNHKIPMKAFKKFIKTSST